MDRTLAVGRTGSRAARIAIRVATGSALSAVAALGVWFVGYDSLWSIAMVLAVGPVGALLATLRYEEDTVWDPPARETPRGVRLVIATMEASLAACDRLARPPVARRLRAFLIPEREDRLARSAIVRRMRALLVAELQSRGLDPGKRADEDAVISLFGAESLAILQPHDSNPVTTAAIARCLDAVERLATETQGSR